MKRTSDPHAKHFTLNFGSFSIGHAPGNEPLTVDSAARKLRASLSDLDEPKTKDLLRRMGNEGVDVLKLNDLALSTEEVQLLARSFQALGASAPPLREILLSNTKAGTFGCLLEAWAGCIASGGPRSLEVLDLGGLSFPKLNKTGQTHLFSLQESHVKLICDLVRQSPALRRLHLDRHTVFSRTPATLKSLRDALRTSPIRELSLTDCGLHDAATCRSLQNRDSEGVPSREIDLSANPGLQTPVARMILSPRFSDSAPQELLIRLSRNELASVKEWLAVMRDAGVDVLCLDRASLSESEVTTLAKAFEELGLDAPRLREIRLRDAVLGTLGCLLGAWLHCTRLARWPLEVIDLSMLRIRSVGEPSGMQSQDLTVVFDIAAASLRLRQLHLDGQPRMGSDASMLPALASKLKNSAALTWLGLSSCGLSNASHCLQLWATTDEIGSDSDSEPLEMNEPRTFDLSNNPGLQAPRDQLALLRSLPLSTMGPVVRWTERFLNLSDLDLTVNDLELLDKVWFSDPPMISNVGAVNLSGAILPALDPLLNWHRRAELPLALEGTRRVERPGVIRPLSYMELKELKPLALGVYRTTETFLGNVGVDCLAVLQEMLRMGFRVLPLNNWTGFPQLMSVLTRHPELIGDRGFCGVELGGYASEEAWDGLFAWLKQHPPAARFSSVGIAPDAECLEGFSSTDLLSTARADSFLTWLGRCRHLRSLDLGRLCLEEEIDGLARLLNGSAVDSLTLNHEASRATTSKVARLLDPRGNGTRLRCLDLFPMNERALPATHWMNWLIALGTVEPGPDVHMPANRLYFSRGQLTLAQVQDVATALLRFPRLLQRTMSIDLRDAVLGTIEPFFQALAVQADTDIVAIDLYNTRVGASPEGARLLPPSALIALSKALHRTPKLQELNLMMQAGVAESSSSRDRGDGQALPAFDALAKALERTQVNTLTLPTAVCAHPDAVTQALDRWARRACGGLQSLTLYQPRGLELPFDNFLSLMRALSGSDLQFLELSSEVFRPPTEREDKVLAGYIEKMHALTEFSGWPFLNPTSNEVASTLDETIQAVCERNQKRQAAVLALNTLALSLRQRDMEYLPVELMRKIRDELMSIPLKA